MEGFSELLNRIPGTIYNRENDSNMVKLFTLYAEIFDELNDVLDDLGALKEIDIQSGTVLDEIGKIVKESRRNLTDEEYRGFLRIAIQKNRSSGSLNTLSQLMKLIIGNSNYTLRDLHNAKETRFDGEGLFDGKRLLNSGTSEPAAFDIHVPDGSDNEYITGLVQEVKSAGVSFTVKYNGEGT